LVKSAGQFVGSQLWRAAGNPTGYSSRVFYFQGLFLRQTIVQLPRRKGMNIMTAAGIETDPTGLFLT
jgi:hypothetical protein